MLTFLGIGAQKSGTTWLFEMLRRHPEVSMAQNKELHYWDHRHKNDETFAQYLENFSHMHGKARGEITPAYAILSPEIIKYIYQKLPHLKLIYILRNPIERAWSAARMDFHKKYRGSPNENALISHKGWFFDHFESESSISRGDYATCLENWRAFYADEALHIEFYENIACKPREFLQRIASHIDVSEEFFTSYAKLRFGDRVYPEESLLNLNVERKALDIPSEFKRKLAELYMPKLKRLLRLLPNRNIENWLQSANQSIQFN